MKWQNKFHSFCCWIYPLFLQFRRLFSLFLFAAPANYLLLTSAILGFNPWLSLCHFMVNMKSLLLLLFSHTIALGLVKNWALIAFWGKQDNCTCLTIPVIPLFYLSHLLRTVIVTLLFNKWWLHGIETWTTDMVSHRKWYSTNDQAKYHQCPLHVRGYMKIPG